MYLTVHFILEFLLAPKPNTFVEQRIGEMFFFYPIVQFSWYLVYHYFCFPNSWIKRFLIWDLQTEYEKQQHKWIPLVFQNLFLYYIYFFSYEEEAGNTIFLASKDAFHCDMKWCISSHNVVLDIKLIMFFLWI